MESFFAVCPISPMRIWCLQRPQRTVFSAECLRPFITRPLNMQIMSFSLVRPANSDVSVPAACVATSFIAAGSCTNIRNLWKLILVRRIRLLHHAGRSCRVDAWLARADAWLASLLDRHSSWQRAYDGCCQLPMSSVSRWFLDSANSSLRRRWAWLGQTCSIAGLLGTTR
jgi:hypothetical protein